jgi:hypothetical protein
MALSNPPRPLCLNSFQKVGVSAFCRRPSRIRRILYPLKITARIFAIANLRFLVSNDRFFVFFLQSLCRRSQRIADFFAFLF